MLIGQNRARFVRRPTKHPVREMCEWRMRVSCFLSFEKILLEI